MDSPSPSAAHSGPADALSRIRPPVRIDDRLTVRHRLADGSATDVVGWVTGLDDTAITLVTPMDAAGVGEQHTVQRERIILAKRVPPALGSRPLTRVTAEELQRAAMTGWIADAEPLGRWTLRWGGGFTGRANSCLAVGDPGIELTAAAATMIDFYQSRGLEPRAQVIDGSLAEQGLRRLGWSDTYALTTVMVQPLAELIGDHRRNPRVRIDGELTEDWWQSYLHYRPISDHHLARRILSGPAPVGLAGIRDQDGRVIALGRGQVSGEWVGLAALWTDPEHRRQGLATMIIRELGHWAARYGARAAYLQVEKANAAAIAAYTGLGFTRHHDYRYLSPDDSSAAS